MKYLVLISFIIFYFHFSYSQDLDLNKTDIKLEEKRNTIKLEEKRDTVKRISGKINYSYFSGLDLFYFDNQDKINGSKSGIISLSFHYRANKWKYGIGMNFSNYKASYNKYYDIQTINFIYSDNLNTSNRILTPFVTIERFLNKNLYLGLHLGCNFIKTENKHLIQYEYVTAVTYNVTDEKYQETFHRILPYTKFCVGYQFKLSNHLNFNLELGVGGSMTNTGVSYLFR